jgi:GNAT superfamily N-acetyltransferase
MTDFTIRPADSNDTESLCLLYYQFHEYHAQRLPERLCSLGSYSEFDSSQLRTSLLHIFADTSAVLFVAELAGQIVGFVELYLRSDDSNPMRVSYTYVLLQSLMVLEAFRHRGIGTALVTAAESWAKEQSAVEIRLDIWEFPGDPLGFYQAFGYQTIKRQLVRQLKT